MSKYLELTAEEYKIAAKVMNAIYDNACETMDLPYQSNMVLNRAADLREAIAKIQDLMPRLQGE